MAILGLLYMMRSDVDGLQSFVEDIWITNGPRVRFVAASLPARMIVVKLGDGSLWINSPVAVSGETLNQIESIGPVRYLVAPTTLHVWRLEPWRKRFPDAQLWDLRRYRAGLRISGLPDSYKTLPRRAG